MATRRSGGGARGAREGGARRADAGTTAGGHGAEGAGEADAGLAARLHPRVAGWFTGRFGAFTDAQRRCVPHILAGRSVLLSSPTGSGKTLAAFLGIVDHLVRESEREGGLGDGVRAVYVSPLRALTYDMRKNLEEPLREMGLADAIRVGMRTGDTPSRERAAFRRRPPHIFLTTPESLAILLCHGTSADIFGRCRFVVVDELHALAENKRGMHLAVTLERLETLTNPPSPRRRAPRAAAGAGAASRGGLCRIGLSATVAPLGEVAAFLVGPGRECAIEDALPGRRSIVEVLSPLRRDPYPPAGFTGARLIRDIAGVVERHRSVIVFTNTRSGAENISHRLKAALPGLAEAIATHHGSLDRDVRLEVEDRLKAGELRAVVCSTSLELGIDVGAIDAVVMVSTPKGISRTLQRIGRSGHSIHRSSHGILCATNINDLVECVVCARMAQERRLDPVRIPDVAVDVAAQHIVGMAFGEGVTRAGAHRLLRKTHPFRRLSRGEFDRIVDYLLGGGRSLEGRYADTFGKVVEGARGRLRTASRQVERDYLVNVGTIHSEGMVSVYLGSRRRRLGGVEEGFLQGLEIGDTFVLAGRVVQLVETGPGAALVEPAAGVPSVPSWNANKMPLASGLAREVTAFRTEMDRILQAPGGARETILDRLVEEWTISLTNADAILKHFENQLAVSAIPTDRRMLVELFRGDPDLDDDGRDAPSASQAVAKPRARARSSRDRRRPGRAGDNLHFFFHSLIGRSANDALSRIVAYRLKNAVGGNAMVTIDDYGFLLTLRAFQELGVEEWRELFRPDGAEDDLAAALENSELVKWQFRGVAQTGLMVPRNLPGRETRHRRIQWNTEILFRVLREHEPDHPLLDEARREAAHTFLDVERAIAFLTEAHSYEWRQVEVPVVTPFAFGLYASRIREGMMFEDPEEAIERLYHRMAQRLTARQTGTQP